VIPRGPRCNASEAIRPELYYCYLGISLEDGDDAYLLGEEWGDGSTRFAQRGHNCTGKLAATRQIPGVQSSSTKNILTSTSTITIVCILLSPTCSLVNSRYNRGFEMPHSFGYRARTRHMFKKGFKGMYIQFVPCH
jgi:hypothetical protein